MESLKTSVSEHPLMAQFVGGASQDGETLHEKGCALLWRRRNAVKQEKVDREVRKCIVKIRTGPLEILVRISSPPQTRTPSLVWHEAACILLLSDNDVGGRTGFNHRAVA